MATKKRKNQIDVGTGDSDNPPIKVDLIKIALRQAGAIRKDLAEIEKALKRLQKMP